MRTTVFVMALVAVLTLAVATSWGQQAEDRADQASQIEQAKIVLQWMKEGASRLDEELLQARRERNTKKINCIEDRLQTLKEIISESDGMYQELRAAALQQRVPDAAKLFAQFMRNRNLAEQIVRLVDDCYRNINEQGGFVETLEEWLGDLPAELNLDPTAVNGETMPPEPVPNEFTPGPVSEEEEE